MLEIKLIVCPVDFSEFSIRAFARAREVDLIVMGTHGRRGFDRRCWGR
jgi:nucleotide-binding universal stress UspA family protein